MNNKDLQVQTEEGYLGRHRRAERCMTTIYTFTLKELKFKLYY